MGGKRKLLYLTLVVGLVLSVIYIPVLLSATNGDSEVGKVEGSVNGTVPFSFSPADIDIESGVSQTVTISTDTGVNMVDGIQLFVDITGNVPDDIAFLGRDLTADGLRQVAADIIDGNGATKKLRVLYITSDPTSYFQSGSPVVLGELTFTAPPAGQMVLTTNAALTKIIDHESGLDIAKVSNPITYGFTTPQANLQKARLDYDKDNSSDMAIFRPNEAARYVFQSQKGFRKIAFGSITDTPVFGGDYDGDGQIDEAVYRASESKWIIFESGKGLRQFVFGAPSDTPINIGDIDGDGKTDVAVYRTSNQTRYVLQSQKGYKAIPFGQAGDLPVHGADYDGDKIADIAIFRPSNQTWYLFKSSEGYLEFSVTGKVGTPINGGDFDGDGRTDIALFRSDLATRYIWQSEVGYREIRYGAPTDMAVHGSDFDGDGKADVAVYRAEKGLWIMFQSRRGQREIPFGAPTDRPI